MIECKDISVKPFLRWAGGKSWLVNDILNLVPEKIQNYHEPFLGSGSIFIALKSKKIIQGNSFLSDTNFDLINSFKQVKRSPNELIERLKKFKNNEDFYYRIRNKDSKSNLDRAANFIYLNRTCFNGIYRVNLNGDFNVPFGFKNYKKLFDYNNLLQIHRLLNKDVKFFTKDFFETLNNVKSNDLVFIDPPYTVNHEHNGFVKYNEKIFSWEDQIRLKDFLIQIIKKNAYFILTNACHESISQLFGSLVNPLKLTRPSLIGGKRANRGYIHEYIFTNLF